MGIHIGLINSHRHPENGMTLRDMQACICVANRLNEVIIFRSTGPWAQKWILRGYPTKNFHAKGKSADWGPQAGLVPFDGQYSKVGSDPIKAAAGTSANQRDLNAKYIGQCQLTLTQDELRELASTTIQSRRAINRMEPAGTGSFLLHALRSRDNMPFVFLASLEGNTYKISVRQNGTFVPFIVVCSMESGANRRPMTGDYDLMAICPSWTDYGSHSLASISKPGLKIEGLDKIRPGQTFPPGSGMDQVMEPALGTGARRRQTLKQLEAQWSELREHPDMGNLTPRILRCINELNLAMGAVGDNAALRRVHHNAESHRNALFGALRARDMENDDDGFPLTIFQPASLYKTNTEVATYRDVCTLEKMSEFREYAARLHQAGFYVPRNWTWGMSIRDQYKIARPA